jgi:cytochrome c553
MADFKSGARTSAVPQRLPVVLMIATAKDATDEEIREAAAYFSALKLPSNLKVVETDIVPKTYVFGWHLAAVTTGETEPLGQRIIEVPDDLEQFVSRDGRARFTAYVPPGSIEKGRNLAAGTSAHIPACAVCHGPELKGLGPIPGIAGRSPIYIVRQFYDFKSGARAGIGSALMKPTVERLSLDDMISLAAYAASLSP